MQTSGDTAGPDIAAAVGAQIGLTVADRAGEGAAKVCYRATDERGATVALKIFKAQASFTGRNARELDVMEKCDHPAIARLRGHGTVQLSSGPVAYVVEDFFGGGSLTGRVFAAPLSREAVLRVGEVLIGAIAHLHARDVVHRDIKPDNVMFATNSDSPCLVDFGIARVLGDTSLTFTWQQQGPGTPIYAPPEQLNNEKALINWRADQFSLGVTLSVAGLWLHPFGDPRVDAGAVVAAVARKRPPTAAFVTAATNAGLPVLVRMVQPWPHKRIRNPIELAQEWLRQ